MTCRHSGDDPHCSSYRTPAQQAESLKKQLEYLKQEHNLRDEPDNTDFEIVEYHEDGPWLALKVRYPSCEKCSYEGVKVLVYYNIKPIDVMRWKVIDPHFREHPNPPIANEAPPPVARFPANDTGWARACAYGTWNGGRP